MIGVTPRSPGSDWSSPTGQYGANLRRMMAAEATHEKPANAPSTIDSEPVSLPLWSRTRLAPELVSRMTR